MEEKDFKRIEKMIEQRDRKLREHIGSDMDRKVISLREEIGNMDRKIGTLRQEINEDFKHHLGIFTEDLHSKLQLVCRRTSDVVGETRSGRRQTREKD